MLKILFFNGKCSKILLISFYIKYFTTIECINSLLFFIQIYQLITVERDIKFEFWYAMLIIYRECFAIYNNFIEFDKNYFLQGYMWPIKKLK